MSKTKALKAISLLWLGSVLGAGCAFLTQVILARKLGPEAFGLFASALAVVVLVSPLASFGVGGFWLKVFGQEGWRAIRWLRGSLKYTLLTTSLVLATLLLWAFLGPHDENTRILLSVLSFYLLGQVVLELASAKLQLEERYSELALWQFLPHFLRLFFVVFLSFLAVNWFSLYAVGYVYASVSISIFIIGAVLIFSMCVGEFSLKGHGEERSFYTAPLPKMNMVIAQSWPFGMAGLFHLIYFQSDIIILKYIKGDEVAGIYNVIFVVMAAVYILPSVVYQKFLLPKIHRWAQSDRERFYEVYRTGNWIMLGLGLLAMVLLWVLAPYGIPILFGDDYSDAIIPLIVIAIAAPFRFLATSMGSTLVTQDNMRVKVFYMGATALLNIIMNFSLIPSLGLFGAVASTIVSEIFLLLLYFRGVKTIFPEKIKVFL